MKKIFWMKLEEHFFDQDEIVYLESKENGGAYIKVWLKLLLKCLKTSENAGFLRFNDQVPFDDKLLANVLREDVEMISQAMQEFAKIGLIEILDDGTIYVEAVQHLIGKSSDSAERVRKHREKKEQHQSKGVTKGENVTPDDVTCNAGNALHESESNGCNALQGEECNGGNALPGTGCNGNVVTCNDNIEAEQEEEQQQKQSVTLHAAAAVMDNLRAVGLFFSTSAVDKVTRALIDHDVGPDFIPFAEQRIRTRPEIKNPPGFLKNMLSDLDAYADWIASYREYVSKQTSARASPPRNCTRCNGPIRTIGDEDYCWCVNCKLVFEYDSDFDAWLEAPESDLGKVGPDMVIGKRPVETVS